MRRGVVNLNHSLARILHRIQHDEGLRELINVYGLLVLVVETCWSISVGQDTFYLIDGVKRKCGIYDDSTYVSLELLVTQFVSELERELVPYRVTPNTPVHVDLLLFDIAHGVMTVDVQVGWRHDRD